MNGTKLKRILIVGIIAFVFVLFAISFVLRHSQEIDAQIPDENGESKELCRLTNADIEGCYTDYRIIGRSVYNKGLGDSNVKGRYEDFDSTYCRVSLGKLSGVYITNAYLADGGTVTYTVDAEVIEGNFRIVITDEQNKILYDVPIDEKTEISFETVENATYYVKLIGESAKIKLELWRTRT